MPTGTDKHPFAPLHEPQRTALHDHAAGRTPPDAQHAIERELELDPLLQEASEGLRLPGALDGLATLDARRPRTRPGKLFTAGVATGAILLAGVWLVVSTVRDEDLQPASVVTTEIEPGSVEYTPPVPVPEMIVAATEQPESLRIGHDPGDRHAHQGAALELAEPEEPVERGRADQRRRVPRDGQRAGRLEDRPSQGTSSGEYVTWPG